MYSSWGDKGFFVSGIGEGGSLPDTNLMADSHLAMGALCNVVRCLDYIYSRYGLSV